MRKRDKTCAKATPEETKTRAAHGMPDERRRAADRGPLSGEVQDNEQITLAEGDYSHVYP